MKNRKLYLLITIFLSAVVFANTDSPGSDAEIKYPDPSRWEKNINEFRQWDSKNAGPNDPILFVGSSSIVGWKTAQSFPDLPVINRGFGGSYAADVLHYIDDVVLKYKPEVVVIYEGDNDIEGSIPPEKVHKDFVQLMERIHEALPQTEIICLAAKICGQRWDRRTAITELNRLNRSYSETKDYITFVDTAAVLLAPDGTPKSECFKSDQLHLSEEGYIAWNRLLRPVLMERYQAALKK